MKITVKKIGKPLRKVIVESTKKLPMKIKKELNKLGMSTRDKMRDKVNPKRPGSTGNLQKAITLEFTKDGWGVGNRNLMDSKAKYWRAQNYGSDHIVGLRLPPGEFTPGNPKPSPSSFGQGRWKKGGRYSVEMKKPIPAKNFIEKTRQWFGLKITEFVSKLKGVK